MGRQIWRTTHTRHLTSHCWIPPLPFENASHFVSVELPEDPQYCCKPEGKAWEGTVEEHRASSRYAASSSSRKATRSRNKNVTMGARTFSCTPSSARCYTYCYNFAVPVRLAHIQFCVQGEKHCVPNMAMELVMLSFHFLRPTSNITDERPEE